MKRLGIILASALFSLSAMAQKAEMAKQNGKSPEEKAKFQTEKMSSELSLTEQQKTQIYDINLKINQKNESLDQSLMTAEERKKGHHANNQARKKMIAGVLTAEQNALLEKKLEERKREKMQHQEKRKEMMKQKLKEKKVSNE